MNDHDAVPQIKGSKNSYCKTRTYVSWSGMKARCGNKNATHYNRYGGRGISYSPEWSLFLNFLKDMGERPEGMDLDRINGDENYSKENCRWVTKSQNQANRRSSKALTKTRGVRKHKKRFQAKIKIQNQCYHIGTFDTEKQAYEEYGKLFFEWFGFSHPERQDKGEK